VTRNIDIGLLRAFLAVVETGSVTRAAQLLNLTQAAVSQQVTRLEDLFGVELFDRANRAMRTTPAGERLIAHARQMLTHNDLIWGLMSEPQFEGEVRVGVPQDLVQPDIPPILRRFDRAWPRVEVSLTAGVTSDLLQALDRGELDLTLTTEKACPEHAELLLCDPLVWVGAIGGEAHRRRPLPVALGGPSCAFRQAVVAALAAIGCDWRPMCEVSILDALKATLYADTAVAPMLLSVVPDGLAVLDAEAGLPDLPPFCINLHMRRAGRPAVADEFAQFVRQEFASRYGDRRRASDLMKRLAEAKA
jgi:DNA-binding transcriptional LysR family regulator